MRSESPLLPPDLASLIKIAIIMASILEHCAKLFVCSTHLSLHGSPEVGNVMTPEF